MRKWLVFLFLLFPVNAFSGINGVDIEKTLDEQLLSHIVFGSFEDVRLSLLMGADVNTYDIRLNTALHHAVESEDSLRKVKILLVDYQAYPNPRNEFGNMPLHGAAHSNEDPRVHILLLDNGADVHAEGELGDHPIHRAARLNKNPEVFSVLYRYGADIKATNKRGDTPLEVAEYSKNLVAIGSIKQRLCHLSFE